MTNAESPGAAAYKGRSVRCLNFLFHERIEFLSSSPGVFLWLFYQEKYYFFYLILRMKKLERKLEENKIKEEKEARDLEAMVQHVEQNLQLMTVSAAIPISYSIQSRGATTQTTSLPVIPASLPASHAHPLFSFRNGLLRQKIMLRN